MPVEPPSQRQAAITMPEHGGRSVRLEELSLAERLLSTAMEMAQLGDLSSAQAILARLNQQVPLKGQQLPSQRVIPLFVDALAKWVSASSPSAPSRFQQHSSLANSPLDLIKKISAYKKFCEVSPISQFAHFTANQAILDAIEGEDHVHLIDFELGFGGQWASFMQELSQRCRGPPELKITTMGTNTLETKLAKENLLQFATEMGIKLEVNVVPLEKLEFVKSVVANKACKEAVAVNFGFAMNRMISDFASMEEVLSFLQLVKTLCPKVIAVMDSECEFDGPSGLSEALQFYSCILESLDASTKLSAEVVSNIEGLVLGPKIGELVTARLTNRSSTDGGALPQWRILLQKVGFSPCPFSSAAESQASWLVNNPLNLGFTYSKQQATLFLGWYNKTLVSASAWGP
ncbi:hypothetical protein KP509_08G011800 [Ceratopteris richardii]|nr:hypothetical protein KP509_08G011800 [Ceratopteris richardii]